MGHRHSSSFWREVLGTGSSYLEGGEKVLARFSASLAVAVVILGTGAIHARMPATTRADRGEAFVPRPEVARIASLGFDAAVADYFWLQAIQTVGGGTEVDAEVGRQLGKIIDVVTTLDPHVDHAYRFAAIWLTASEENVRTANDLLRRGIEHHPDEWRNYFYLGFNHFFYLLEDEEAAGWLEKASRLPGAPLYLPRLVARLRSETADIDVAEVFLRELVRATEDEHAIAEYESALDEIEMEKKARYLDGAREAFIERNGRDIMSVDELLAGGAPGLRRLPSPEPDGLPSSLSRGSVWKLDFESDRIVSTYYGHRYKVHFSPMERERATLWREQRLQSESAPGASRGDVLTEGQVNEEVNEEDGDV